MQCSVYTTTDKGKSRCACRATYWLKYNGVRLPLGRMCHTHAQRDVDQYTKEVGGDWTAELIDELGNRIDGNELSA